MILKRKTGSASLPVFLLCYLLFYLKLRLFAPCVFLALQGKVVGNHGDAFAIGGLCA